MRICLAVITLVTLTSCTDKEAPPPWQPSSIARSQGDAIPIRVLHFSAEDIMIIGNYDGPDRYTIMQRTSATSPWVVVDRDWPEGVEKR